MHATDEQNALRNLLKAAQGIDALIRKYGLGDEDRETEPVLAVFHGAMGGARDCLRSHSADGKV